MLRNILRWGGLVTTLLLSLAFVQLALFSLQAHASGGNGPPNYCQQRDATEVAVASDPDVPFLSDVVYDRCDSRIYFYIHAQGSYPAFQIDYRTPGMLEEAHTIEQADYQQMDDSQGRHIYSGMIVVEQNDTTYTFHARTCVTDHRMVSSYRCSQSWSNTMAIYTNGFSSSPSQ